MKQLKLKLILAMLAVSGFALTSCNGPQDYPIVSPEEAKEMTETAQQYAQSSGSIGEAIGSVSSYGISEDWSKKGAEGEPRVTYDPQSHIVIITYPNDQGVITIDWNKKPQWTATELTGVATFTNFKYGKITVNGTLDIASVGTNTQPELKVNGTLVTAAGNDSTTHNIDNNFIWHAGFSTPATNDDAFAIHGKSTVTDKNNTLTTSILENKKLIKYNNCDYPQQGTIKIDFSGKNKEITMNYSSNKDGQDANLCDKWVKLTLKSGNASISVTTELN